MTAFFGGMTILFLFLALIVPPVGLTLAGLSFVGFLISGLVETSKVLYQVTRSLLRLAKTLGYRIFQGIRLKTLNAAVLSAAEHLELSTRRSFFQWVIHDSAEHRDLSVEHTVLDARALTAFSLSGQGQFPMSLRLCSYSDDFPRRITNGNDDLYLWRPYARIGHSSERIPELEHLMDIVVEGPEQIVYAVLTHELREPIRSLIQDCELIVSYGGINYDIHRFESDEQELIQIIEKMEALAGLLRLNSDQIPRRLYSNFLHEELLTLRLRNLELLQFFYPTHSATRECSKLALEGEDPRLRFLGAVHLTEEGTPILEALLNDDQTPSALRVLSLEQLAKRAEDKAGLLIPILTGPHKSDMLTGSAIELLGLYQCSEALPALREWVRNNSSAFPGSGFSFDPEVMAKAIRTLQMLRDPEAEGLLIPMLSGSSAPIVEAAAEVLSAVGSAAALRPLGACSERFTEAPFILEVLKQAIFAIRTRHDVEAGQLSMMEVSEAGGGLSVTEEEGQLSLSEDAGALSLEPGDPR